MRELGAPRPPFRKQKQWTPRQKLNRLWSTRRSSRPRSRSCWRFVGYYYFADASVALRSLGVLVALGIAVLVALQSAQGQSLWRFIQTARIGAS